MTRGTQAVSHGRVAGAACLRFIILVYGHYS